MVTEPTTGALPPEIVAAVERAQEGLDEATVWLSEHGRELSQEGADSVVSWAQRILRLVGREPLPERRPLAEIKAENRQSQHESGPTTIPQSGREEPTIEVDKQADRVRLVFEVSLAQFWALEAAGRAKVLSRNVQDRHVPFGVSWEDERCARYAISSAMSETYPEIVAAPTIQEEAVERAAPAAIEEDG